MNPRRRLPRGRRAWTAALCALLAALLTMSAGASLARPASAAGRVSANPLAGGPWGIDAFDDLAKDWAVQTGTTKTLLGKIERQSRVRWFTGGIATNDVTTVIGRYIANVQAGDPNVLVPLALFRIFPGGEKMRTTPLTSDQINAYRAWMRQAVQAIGSTRAVVVLEPDLAEVGVRRPGGTHVPDALVREHLVRYAAQLLSALPATTVYLDAGDSDWLSIADATTLMVNSGVGYARGFALGATHYSVISSNIAYAKKLEASLAAAGLPGKKAVLDTADNGRGFTFPYWRAHEDKLGTDFDNPTMCATKQSTLCDTLGHVPTWNVGTYRAQYVDAFLWFGRPWLTRQAYPYNRSRSLQAARSTPYSMVNVTG